MQNDNDPSSNAALWRAAALPTPGTWHARGGQIWAATSGPIANLVALIATVEPGVHAKADSQLLAAAPELRAALRAVVAVFANTDSNDLPQLIAARRALRKSEGR